ncbi:MAG: SDR family NAD(P)-dependent oxidoreductase, partial [Opitutaceae bacterium]|nr:SDR family NAD(P)-dependent oxidoreductase [Verrucomicrobiales bacterium]
MSHKLSEKVALVTGASKGIGAAIAKLLAEEGAAVAVNYSSSKIDGDKIVAEITAAGGKAVAIQANVSKPADIVRLIEETVAAFGRIDILVNNAGIYEFAPLGEISEEHFHRQFNLNVLGLALCTQ